MENSKEFDIKPETVLHLAGVFKDDLDHPDVIIEEKLCPVECERSDPEYKFDKMRAKLRITEEYTNTTTNLRCWNCSGFFESFPWFVPTNFCWANSGKQYYKEILRMGSFCSAPCAAKYMIDYIPKNQRTTFNEMLYHLVEAIYGKKVTYVPSAHSKLDLKEFGGHMTRKEFKEWNDFAVKKMLGLVN